MTNEEYKLKVQWDLDGAVYSAYENGIKAGRLAVENGTASSKKPETFEETLQRNRATAKKLKNFGISPGVIIKITDLTPEKIEIL